MLGDCFELKRGYDLTASQMNLGNIPVAGSNGIVGFHNVEKSNRPCITVGRSGSVGKVHYYDIPTWAHNTTLFIKDFKGNNPKYLYYYLKNLRLDTFFGKEASVIPSLDRKKVHAIAALFEDNVEKQTEIANLLSLLDNKIALNRQINDNLLPLDHSLAMAGARLVA